MEGIITADRRSRKSSSDRSVGRARVKVDADHDEADEAQDADRSGRMWRLES